MCFWKSKQSKVLKAKRDIKVYKIGVYADKGIFNPAWYFDCFYIHKGYHSYLTKKIAKYMKNPYDKIGIFEIPAGATIYFNYRSMEVVSTDIKYLRLLKW